MVKSRSESKIINHFNVMLIISLFIIHYFSLDVLNLLAYFFNLSFGFYDALRNLCVVCF